MKKVTTKQANRLYYLSIFIPIFYIYFTEIIKVFSEEMSILRLLFDVITILIILFVIFTIMTIPYSITKKICFSLKGYKNVPIIIFPFLKINNKLRNMSAFMPFQNAYLDFYPFELIEKSKYDFNDEYYIWYAKCENISVIVTLIMYIPFIALTLIFKQYLFLICSSLMLVATVMSFLIDDYTYKGPIIRAKDFKAGKGIFYVARFLALYTKEKHVLYSLLNEKLINNTSLNNKYNNFDYYIIMALQNRFIIECNNEDSDLSDLIILEKIVFDRYILNSLEEFKTAIGQDKFALMLIIMYYSIIKNNNKLNEKIMCEFIVLSNELIRNNIAASMGFKMGMKLEEYINIGMFKKCDFSNSKKLLPNDITFNKRIFPVYCEMYNFIIEQIVKTCDENSIMD